jgi:hypothetical protein
MLLKIIAYIEEEEEETREKLKLMHKQTKTSHANCCKTCWRNNGDKKLNKNCWP